MPKMDKQIKKESKIDEQIKKETEKLEQLKRKKKEQQKRTDEQNRKLEMRRLIFIGEVVTKYFPEVSNYQPCQTKTDNESEFAPLIGFISLLAEDKKYVTDLKEAAKR